MRWYNFRYSLSSYFAKISWLTKDGFSHEEAKNLTKEGFYDDDGNWVYYEQCPPEPAQNKVTQPLQQPNNTAQVKPPLLQNQKQQQQTKTPHEVQAAKDEAAKAAQEAAKAAKEASKGLFKGLTSFGGNVKNQAQQQQQQAQGKGSGGLFGGDDIDVTICKNRVRFTRFLIFLRIKVFQKRVLKNPLGEK